jgi:hypothetical protein
MKPSTYRIADGSAIDFTDAKVAWAASARPILEGIARRYRATITYKELAEEVQAASGIRTGMQMRHWIGGVLFIVAHDGHRRGEPILSALCVHADGTIGDGFAEAIARTYGQNIGERDIEMRSAVERQACYRWFGATLPADGGSPALTPEVAAKRERARRRSTPLAPLRVCPTCWLALPMSGQCDNCSSRA